MSNASKSIAVGADDAAFELKAKIVEHLRARGVQVEDYGVVTPDPAILYPDVALTVAEAVASGKHDRGILMCGTGIGVAITANKVPGIRAAVCHDSYSAERSRKSNDCQIMTLGGRVVGEELAKSLVDIWLASDYQGGRSAPKVERMKQIDEQFHSKLKGFVKCHKHLVAPIDENPRVIKYAKTPVQGKVGVVTGGGSGHKPAFIGYVGKNMCDAVAVGEIFSSPSAQVFFDAFKAANGGAGIACLYGNYAGDNMNVKMAKQLAAMEGIEVKTVVANDDVASAPKSEPQKRRGVAGEVLMWKVGGAKAALGGSLDDVIRVAQKAIDNTRSIGVGLSSCTIPAAGKPNFHIEPGKMEVGIGHHGEPGVLVSDLKSADEIASLALDYILKDLPFQAGDDVVVLVSGLGATPVMELYIAFNKAFDLLQEAKINVHRSYVGNYFTSLEMMGITFTIMKVDDELKPLVDMEAESMGLTQLAPSA
jgi:dihydroxyacetone kinase-like protein